MNTFTFWIDWIGRITSIIFILTFMYGVYLWLKGIFPATLRLGNGLAKRKVAIFAKGDNFTSLRDLLIDSKLFSQKNIMTVSVRGDFGRAEEQTIFLVYWPDMKANLQSIIDIKKDNTALIVYAPQEMGFIPSSQMTLLNGVRNVTVTNFRGRLLNDLVVSMITTGFGK